MIPNSVSKVLPETGKLFYKKVYNESFSRHGDEELATMVAWNMTKSRFTKVGDEFVALSESFVEPELVSFQLNPVDDEFVINAEGDEITFEGILADTSEFVQSALPYKVRKFSEEALSDLAEQINNFGSSTPDVDHEVLNKLISEYNGNIELIANAMKKRKGLIKSIQAVVKDGKLWIKGKLDSRYKKIMSRVKGMSIESITNNLHSDGKTIKGSKYLGFTFALNDTPKIAGAKLVNVY